MPLIVERIHGSGEPASNREYNTLGEQLRSERKAEAEWNIEGIGGGTGTEELGAKKTFWDINKFRPLLTWENSVKQPLLNAYFSIKGVR